MTKKGKTIPVTGHGGSWGSETSKLPHLVDSRLARWRWGCQPYAPVALYLPPSPPGKPQGRNAAGRINSIEKSTKDLIGNRTRRVPATLSVKNACRYSSVYRRATGLDDLGSIRGRGTRFISVTSTPTLGTTQPLINGYRKLFSGG
jgi:hypothetical protein